MSVGAWFALVAIIVALVALGLVAVLLINLDSRKSLRLIKIDARIGRWFGLAIQVDRDMSEDDEPLEALARTVLESRSNGDVVERPGA